MIQTETSKRTIILFATGILCFWASMYVYVPTFSVYAERMGATLSVVGLAVGMYGLTQLLTRIPIGIWSDARGQRRNFVVVGMLICGVAAVGLALSPSPFWLVIFRGVMGLAAATWVCSTVLFTSFFPKSDPSVPLSIMSFMSTLGQVLATSIGGMIAEKWGWTAPFWVSTGLSVVAFLVLSRVPEDKTAHPTAITARSMLRIAKAPLLLLACGVGIVLYFVTFSTIYSFTPVLAERLGATRAQLGYLTTAAFFCYGLVTITSSRIVTLLGERRSLLIGLAVVTVAVLSMPTVKDPGGLAVLEALSGFGRGLLYPLLMSLSIKAVTAQDRASAMGIFQASYAFGMFIGPWISGGVADAQGLGAVFLLCGGLCLLCLIGATVFSVRTREWET